MKAAEKAAPKPVAAQQPVARDPMEALRHLAAVNAGGLQTAYTLSAPLTSAVSYSASSLTGGGA